MQNPKCMQFLTHRSLQIDRGVAGNVSLRINGAAVSQERETIGLDLGQSLT